MDPRTATFGALYLPPLVLAAGIALGARRTQRLVLALSLGALALSIAGVALLVSVGFRSLEALAFLAVSGLYQTRLETGWALISSGLGVLAGAAILGLSRSAQVRSWRWFGLMVLFTLLSPLAATVALNPLAFFDAQGRLDELKTGLLFGVPYELVGSILVLLMPLGTLLYGLMGPDRRPPG